MFSYELSSAFEMAGLEHFKKINNGVLGRPLDNTVASRANIANIEILTLEGLVLPLQLKVGYIFPYGISEPPTPSKTSKKQT